MDEIEFLPFLMWSGISGITMLITGLSYRVYLRKNNPNFSSTVN